VSCTIESGCTTEEAPAVFTIPPEETDKNGNCGWTKGICGGGTLCELVEVTLFFFFRLFLAAAFGTGALGG
jgi:hypothetical protein